MQNLSVVEFDRLMNEAGSSENLEVQPESVRYHEKTTPGYIYKLGEYKAWFEYYIEEIDDKLEKRKGELWLAKSIVDAAGKAVQQKHLIELLSFQDERMRTLKEKKNQLVWRAARASALLKSLDKKCSLLPGLQGWTSRQSTYQ